VVWCGVGAQRGGAHALQHNPRSCRQGWQAGKFRCRWDSQGRARHRQAQVQQPGRQQAWTINQHKQAGRQAVPIVSHAVH
jgi:hypothetical protein